MCRKSSRESFCNFLLALVTVEEEEPFKEIETKPERKPLQRSQSLVVVLPEVKIDVFE
jgi:hypothetical protein